MSSLRSCHREALESPPEAGLHWPNRPLPGLNVSSSAPSVLVKMELVSGGEGISLNG